ncbi:MAG: GNAT family N-acetyltransferase [Bacteriovoracaceae bacterium]|jgi:GNAT superfamily N-acetyltransferase|nr:GNAT family N-acetyltransferase [Bacteriovoracaceae bacterium]
MRIRKFQKKDTVPSAELIYQVFKKYNGNDYFDLKGVNEVLDLLDAKKRSTADLMVMFSRSSIVYVAEEGKQIIGVIRGSKNKITSLMVDGRFHKRGVGKKLIEKFEADAISLGGEFIKIRSSLFAVSFYQAQGFKKNTGIRKFMGLKVFNMKKNL